MNIHQFLIEINQRDAVSIEPDVNLFEAAELMSSHRIGALPVVDSDDNILGILSERDIVRLLVEKKDGVFDCVVSDAMTPSVITCHETETVDDVLARMNEMRIRHMPVAESGKLVSILSIRDFVSVLH